MRESAPKSPLITLNRTSADWPTAGVTGQLIERGGCLLIGSSVTVFPYGTRWSKPNVVFADGTTIAVGAQVTLVGGYFDVTVNQEDLPIVPVARVQACAQTTGADQFVWAMP